MPDYTPDNLIAGNDFPAITTAVVIKAGQNLQRGAVIGEITAEPGKFKLVDKSAEDGSETAVHVLAESVDATAGDTPGIAYETGIVNPSALRLAEGTTAADVKAALRARSIFLRAVRTL